MLGLEYRMSFRKTASSAKLSLLKFVEILSYISDKFLPTFNQIYRKSKKYRQNLGGSQSPALKGSTPFTKGARKNCSRFSF